MLIIIQKWLLESFCVLFVFSRNTWNQKIVCKLFQLEEILDI